MAIRSAAKVRRSGAKPVRTEVRRFAREAYRQAILDAAERVFSGLDYHQAKMTDVAAQAGVSIGTLYNHFRSKELIFSSLVERGTTEILAELRETTQIEDPEQRLRELVRTTLAFVERRGALFAVYVQLGAVSETDIARVGGKCSEQAYVEYLNVLTRTFEDAARLGRVRSDVPARNIATALSGSMSAAMFEWVHAGRKESLVDRADVILKLLMEGAGSR